MNTWSRDARGEADSPIILSSYSEGVVLLGRNSKCFRGVLCYFIELPPTTLEARGEDTILIINLISIGLLNVYNETIHDSNELKCQSGLTVLNSITKLYMREFLSKGKECKSIY